jgi:hypothetical protein
VLTQKCIDLDGSCLAELDEGIIELDPLAICVHTMRNGPRGFKPPSDGLGPRWARVKDQLLVYSASQLNRLG